RRLEGALIRAISYSSLTGSGNTRKRWVLTAISVVALFVIWQLAAAAVGAQIIVPAPMAALKALGRFLTFPSFWAAVGATLSRGFAGFLLSTAAGIVIGTAAGLNSTFRTLFRPVLSVIRTTPVMSIIIIALIWFTTDTVPVFASFLIAFPVICGNVIQGIDSIDTDLVQMAEVFRVPRIRILFSLVVPSVFTYFLAGASTALGLTWKVVVAAEVLAQPIRAVGTGLYTAKVQLETPEVFAWTVVAILLSGMSEGVFHFLMRRISWSRHGEAGT
ncbi:MAG: ABC transporter permease, partial [Spirochaetia bacterium]